MKKIYLVLFYLTAISCYPTKAVWHKGKLRKSKSISIEWENDVELNFLSQEFRKFNDSMYSSNELAKDSMLFKLEESLKKRNVEIQNDSDIKVVIHKLKLEEKHESILVDMMDCAAVNGSKVTFIYDLKADIINGKDSVGLNLKYWIEEEDRENYLFNGFIHTPDNFKSEEIFMSVLYNSFSYRVMEYLEENE